MFRLNQARRPVLFAVTTSVMSGLVLAGITQALRTGLSAGATVIWFAVAAGGVALLCLAVIGTISLVRKPPSRAFLVTSAFSQKYYVASFVQRVQSALDQDGVDLVIKVPDRDYDAGAQAHHLRRILSRKQDFLGGIIFAGEIHRLHDDLSMFCRESHLPVVFTDVEPFDTESEYPANSAYIGYDTGELGALAGKWLVAHLRGRTRPHVLIIASREHSDRQRRCAQAIHDALPTAVVTVDDGCGFVRSRAYDAVCAHVRQLAATEHLDAVFCTNDEMALGVVDALALPSPATTDTVVIGVDGVLEARALIETGRSRLRATVVQDSHRLAVSVVDLLAKMHRGQPVPKRTILNAELFSATR
ncbi:MAG TPA: substrate-binding domain-containing protein [Pseudonocardiaceae bacterium]|nr:substrate-binding domain-containing protein [Pseudonocardiaceae bacterium]